MKKKILVIILSLSLPFLLIACNDKKEEENLSNKPTTEEKSNNYSNEEKNNNYTEEKSNDSTDNKDEIKDEVKDENAKIYYYDIISDKIVYINKTITIKNKAVVTALVAALKESPNSDISPSIANDITLNSAKLDKDNDVISLDFSSNFITSQNLGSGAESKTLTAICNTFGAYYNVNNVIITLEGKPYSSGHILMKDGEAFKVNLEDTTELK